MQDLQKKNRWAIFFYDFFKFCISNCGGMEQYQLFLFTKHVYCMSRIFRGAYICGAAANLPTETEMYQLGILKYALYSIHTNSVLPQVGINVVNSNKFN